jgi:hypothetical protein
MKLLSRIFSAFLFVPTCSLASGNKVGNGGDVIVCKKSPEVKIELLDFYEESMSLTAPEKEARSIAESVLKNLELSAPELSRQYLKRLRELEAEIDYKSSVELKNIQDSEHLYAPLDPQCKVEQIAIRKAKALPGEKRFLIRKDLWDSLPATHQAGLLTHEIVYEHLTKLGEENSVKARKINRALYQNPPLDKNQFWKLIKNLELPIYP